MEGRLTFWVRLSARWNIVGQIEGEDIYRKWEVFKRRILGTAEYVCGRRKCGSGVKRTEWRNKEVESAIRKKKWHTRNGCK